MTYTYDYPSRTYDGEWGTTYDAELDAVTLTGTDGTTATITLTSNSASVSLSTALVATVEVSDVDL